jgi:endonuclease YncB( thermonuclease family)
MPSLYLHHRCIQRAVALTALLLFLHPALAQTVTGKVVVVHDGDTLTVLTAERRPVKVRLHGIDAPELGQPFGARAKQVLSGLAFGRPVEVIVRDTDSYGRIVGEVFVGGSDPKSININEAMVARGMAFWFRQYAPRASALAALEAEARTARRGLWIDRNPTPPWAWRNGSKTRASRPAVARKPATPRRAAPSGGARLPIASPTPRVSVPVSVPLSDTVYITYKGVKYHQLGCEGLSRSQYPISRKAAVARGYKPCGLCRP